MKTYFKITVLVLLSIVIQSCTKKESNSLEKKEFNESEEVSNIDKSISNGTTDSVVATNYKYWLKDKKIIKLLVFDGNGEDYGKKENYYFKSTGEVFGYKKQEIDFADGVDGHVSN